MGLEVTKVDFTALKGGKGPMKAYAKVTFNNAIEIKGFRIVEGQKGVFASAPQEKGTDGKWYNTVNFPKKEVFQSVMDAILGYYEDFEKGGRKKRRDDDDDDERPRRRQRDEEEEEERPRKKKRDDDDDEEPKPRKKAPKDDSDEYGDDDDDDPWKKKNRR